MIDELSGLRDFIGQLRQFDAHLGGILGKDPTAAQINRWHLTKDAIARLRRQIGHLMFELVVGHVGELAPTQRRPPSR
jgi:hypothetical protein